MCCADLAPAQHERTRAMGVSRKSRWLEKMEREADQLPHKTGNDPTAGFPSLAERTSSSGGKCQNLTVLRAGSLGSVLYLEGES